MTESGLRAVFLAERPTLLKLLRARLGGEDEAEDALQDLWIKLDGQAPGPISHPTAYLFRMANNLALDRRRSTVRRGGRDHGWYEVQSAPEEMPDAERALIARERLAQVEQAVAGLSPRVAMAFRLFRFEEQPRKLVAEQMGISVSAVEKLLQRAYREIYDAVGKNAVGANDRRRLVDKEHRDQ